MVASKTGHGEITRIGIQKSRPLPYVDIPVDNHRNDFIRPQVHWISKEDEATANYRSQKHILLAGKLPPPISLREPVDAA
jgi:hypothetical protein